VENNKEGNAWTRGGKWRDAAGHVEDNREGYGWTRGGKRRETAGHVENITMKYVSK